MNIFNLLSKDITQEELLNYYNATIVYNKLPKYINGFVFYYKGINCIVVNDNLSNYKKKKTILHEIAHIELNQLNQINKDMFEFYVNTYEDEATRYLKYLEESTKEYKKATKKN